MHLIHVFENCKGASKSNEWKCKKPKYEYQAENELKRFFYSKDVRLPIQMQRAMATEAESTREARAKVIAAEGEHKAAAALKLAGDTINQSPTALQLRYLQTLVHISAEKNSTIIFPVPIELMRSFASK